MNGESGGPVTSVNNGAVVGMIVYGTWDSYTGTSGTTGYFRFDSTGFQNWKDSVLIPEPASFALIVCSAGIFLRRPIRKN